MYSEVCRVSKKLWGVLNVLGLLGVGAFSGSHVNMMNLDFIIIFQGVWCSVCWAKLITLVVT